MTDILGTEASRQFIYAADEFLASLFEFSPSMASYMGLHEYDGRVPDYSPEAFAKRARELTQQLATLNSIDTSGFDHETLFDFRLLCQGLEQELFRIDELREQTFNPMSVLWLADVTGYVKRDYAPIEERARKLVQYERGLPRLMQQAQDILEPPLARAVVEIGIEMFTGQATYLRDSLPELIKGEVKDAALLAEFEESNRDATRAVEGYVAFLQGQLANAKESFAIGEKMFERMLAKNELVDMPLERVLEVGRANLKANQQAFIRTARLISTDKDVTEVADMLAADHPTEEGLIPDTADMLEEIRQYLLSENIVAVPSEVRCKVQETPEFMRWGFAFMDPPGPFEQKATEAFYYVTPVEQTWTAEEKEEWLRRFNYGTLRDVSIHEAYPGHYVHFLHSAGVMSPIRKVFFSYSFVEGWAHYCEQMMVEAGYRGDTPVLRFSQLSEALLRNCRYVVSILMHTGRMTVDEATKFLMENAYMEELPARREAVRGTFDPGYLNYTLGKLLILKLREDVKAKRGDKFDLKEFHDQLLSLGGPPVPLVRYYMLGADSGSNL